MTIQQAKQVSEFLTSNPYILDYCDCCSFGENSDEKIKFMKVKSTKIIACNWDSRFFNVKVKVESLASFSYVNGGPDMNSPHLQESAENIEEELTITMNYTWAFNKEGRKLAPFYTIVPYDVYGELELDLNSGSCAEFTTFPNPESMKNEEYTKWYNNRWDIVTSTEQIKEEPKDTQNLQNNSVIFEKAEKLSFGKGQSKFETKKELTLSGNFTISFKLRQTQNISSSTAIGHGALRDELLKPDNKGKALLLGFNESGTFYFSFYNDGFETPNPVSDKKWHNYVCTYNAQTRERKIFIDGKLVATNTSQSKYIGIGKFYIGGTSWEDSNFEGMISNVKVYNKVMTPSELK